MHPDRRNRISVSGLRYLLLAVVAIFAVAPRVALAATNADATVAQLIIDLGAALDGRAMAALESIDGSGRRLLALRSYLRSHRNLGDRWSWTEEQIRAYEGSAEQRELQQEIERVRAAFVAANPGFQLWVNPQVRSLDVQLEHWNENESVERAGAKLLVDLKAFLASFSPAGASPTEARSLADEFLRSYLPSPAPTLAAPGLSAHGQMRAVDFQVHRGDTVIAGPSASSIAADWDAGGWAGRLDNAVRSASQRFIGPLVNPREPWHYTFTPDRLSER